MILLCVDSTVILLEIEDTCSNKIFLPDARLTLSIKVPDRFRKGFHHIGLLGLKNIEDMMPRDDIQLAAFARLVDAKKAYDINRIGVEILPRGDFSPLSRQCCLADQNILVVG